MLANRESKRSGMEMFKRCWACLYVSNELLGEKTSVDIKQFTSMRAAPFLKSPTGKRNFHTSSIKKPQPTKYTAERLQGLSQMLPCLGWCQRQLCATTAVRSPGFCQFRVTPAPQAWVNANKTIASSTSYTPRSFVINLLIDGLS